MSDQSDEPIPAVQRYLIAWCEQYQAEHKWVRARSAMVADEPDTRRAIGAAKDHFIEAELLDGSRFKVGIAPNGRDVMVIPLVFPPDA